MKLIDLTSRRFGRWTVLRRSHVFWLCRCDCGTEKLVSGSVLRGGNSKSCGCYRVERGRLHGRTINLRHGEGSNGKESPEYRTWTSLRNRCLNPTNISFPEYGGRGIGVCERWSSYENFLVDMGRRPSARHSIDRIDVNGNYAPENCRWSTTKIQNRNVRSNRTITIDDKTRNLSEWLELYKLSRKTFYNRIERGFTEIEALIKPVRAHKPSREERDLYNLWQQMKGRCHNPNNYGFRNYGARGIEVCERWCSSFANFLTDIGIRPDPTYTLDRIDSNGNYCPENCRWASKKEQARNVRTNRQITIGRRTKPLAEWLEIFNMKSATFYARIRKGWSEEVSLKTPLLLPHESKKIADLHD